MKHLRFNVRDYVEIFGAEAKHPREVIRDAGITYTVAIPQTIAGEWWFFNCENVQPHVEGIISTLDIDDTREYVGWGLSMEQANRIENYKKSKSCL